MPATIRTLSQLPELSSPAQLTPQSLFEVSVPAEIKLEGNERIYKFASKKITKATLAESMISSVRQNLEETNGLSTHVRIDELCAIVDKLINGFETEDGPGTFVLNGPKDFRDNPRIDNTPIEGCSILDDTLDDYSVNFGTLKKYSSINASPSIGPNFGFVTQLSGTRNGSNESSRYLNIFKIDNENHTIEVAPNFVFNQSAKNVAENEYIFRIESGTRSSNSWKAPASGIFTCYGWLDEINNPSQSNESRWVALMGRQSQLDVWTILQVQPFIKNNYLTYVGFTFPVKKGMELRIATGFAVGKNSDKYFAASGSISNKVANAFLGGIYTGLSALNEDGSPYDYDDIPNDYARLTDIADLCEHEITCDEQLSGMITDLCSYVENIPTYDFDLEDELSSKVRYINTAKYTSRPVHVSLNMYNAMFDKNAGEDLQYAQTCLYNGEQTTTAPLKYCSLDDIYNWSFKRYYAPPEHKEDYGSIVGGTVERAYIREAEPPYGRVFSDGKYMFYCVSQDCTALIRTCGDYSPHGTTAIAAYMLLPKSSPTNMTAINIGKSIESFGFVSDPAAYISLPVRKGTIFMFTPWITEKLDNPNHLLTKTISAFDDLARFAWKTLNVPCYIPHSDGSMHWINDIYANSSYTINTRANGVDIPYTSYALWTSDREQRNKVVGSDSSKWDYIFGSVSQGYGDYAHGTIATIVELP